MRPALTLVVIALVASVSPAARAQALDEPWRAAIEVDAPTRMRLASPQEAVAFTLHVRNDGPDAARVLAEVTQRTEGLVATVPVPLRLDGEGGAQRAAVIPFILQTPYHNGQVSHLGTVTLRLTPVDPDDDGRRGEPRDLVFTVQTDGAYVPAAPFFGVIAALALAAALSRRR